MDSLKTNSGKPQMKTIVCLTTNRLSFQHYIKEDIVPKLGEPTKVIGPNREFQFGNIRYITASESRHVRGLRNWETVDIFGAAEINAFEYNYIKKLEQLDKVFYSEI